METSLYENIRLGGAVSRRLEDDKIIRYRIVCATFLIICNRIVDQRLKKNILTHHVKYSVSIFILYQKKI